MKAKNKMTKVIANALLALSLIVGTTGITTLQAKAERAYEPYAISFGGSSVPDKELRKTYITECYLLTRTYGMDNDSSWHYFSNSYCKEGVGYQLRNRSDLKVEPTFAGSRNAGIEDPQILVGGLTAKLVTDSNNAVKLHIEGKYELNLESVWTSNEKEGTGGPVNPYCEQKYKDYSYNTREEYNKWLNDLRKKKDDNGKPGSSIGDDLGVEDPYLHYWYLPTIYTIQLSVNGNKFPVPLNIPNNSMIYDKDAILNYMEEVFAGTFSQDIYLPNANSMDKSQGELSKNSAYQMKASDLQSVVIDWVLSQNTKCGIAVPLDGTEMDCSKHYIEDIGITEIYNHKNDGNADYKIAFITNAMNDNQTGVYTFDLEYTVDGNSNVMEKTVTFQLGERQHADVTVTLPKNAKNFVIKNVYKYDTGTKDTYRYYVKDFRVVVQETSTPDTIVKVSGANESTITFNMHRNYKIYHDPMRGVFEREYPNIAGSATEEMKSARYTAMFEYQVRDSATGQIKKHTKNEPLILKEKSGTIDLSVDFPGDVLEIKYLGILPPQPYNFDPLYAEIVYRNTDGLPAPTEFSADVSATTEIVKGPNVRALALRIDYASPNTHCYEVMMEYFNEGQVNTVVSSGTELPSFNAVEGYHSIGFGDDTAENPGGVSLPRIMSIPMTCKFIRLVGIKDLTDGTVYDYNQYFYCEHSYLNDCDDDCEWCEAVRATDEHPYVWVIDKEATDTEVGVKHEECPICGKKKTPVFIPALVNPDADNGGNGSGGSGSGDDNGGSGSGDANNGNADFGNENGGNASGDANGENASGDDNGGNASGNANGGNASEADIVKGEDGTYLGEGANEAAVDYAILESSSEEEPAGAVFGKLQLKSKKTTKKSIKISWKKIDGCTYVVYGSRCGSKYKKLATTNKNTYTMKKLKKGRYYKFIVVALKDGKVVSTSKSVHIATKGGKVGNYKLVELNKTEITLKKNKTFKIKAKQIKDSKQSKVKNHRGLKYESSNTKVVKVTSKGKIKAVGKGTAYVYVYSQSGVFNKIKVKVK